MIKARKLMLSALAAVSMMTTTVVSGYAVYAADTGVVSSTKDTAGTMEADKSYSGTISSTTGYEKWYKIEAVDYTNYYQFTFKVKDAYSYLKFSVVDDEGYALYDGTVSQQDNITLKLSEGKTYYLKAYTSNRGYYGDYIVSYNVNEDVADEKSGAEYIEADKVIGESICTTKDEDWYKIKAVDYTNYYEFKFTTTDSTNYLKYSVIDSNDMTIGSKTLGSNNSDTVKFKLEPGKDYYVKVSGNGYYTGNYNIQYSVFEDKPDTKSEAEEIKVEETVSDSIITTDDKDWYKIKTVDYTSYYQFSYVTDDTVTNYLSFRVLTEDGAEVNKTTLGSSNSKTINVKLDSDKYYYVEVSGNGYYTGSYKLSAKVDKDAADTKEQAGQIYADQKIAESICATGDEDWYMYRADYAQNFTISLVNEGYDNSIYFDVYNADGEKVINSYAYGRGGKGTKSATLAAGNYYIRVYISGSTTEAYNYNFKVSNTAVETGLKQDSDGVWRYYVNGKQDKSKTGLVYDSNVGWWYVENGVINFDFNDLYNDAAYGWWKVSGGAVDFNYTDLYYSPTWGWWKVSGGAVDFEYTDLYYSPTYGWWKVNKGSVDFSFTDLYNSPTYGWWKVKEGSVDFGFTDLYNSATWGWWKVNGGSVDFGYTDLYYSATWGWWKVKEGSVDFGYTDLYYSPTYGWWKVNLGAVDFGYNGVYNSPTYGSWNISGGSVVFN